VEFYPSLFAVFTNAMKKRKITYNAMPLRNGFPKSWIFVHSHSPAVERSVYLSKKKKTIYLKNK
jgi:hypothetical protein